MVVTVARIGDEREGTDEHPGVERRADQADDEDHGADLARRKTDVGDALAGAEAEALRFGS